MNADYLYLFLPNILGGLFGSICPMTQVARPKTNSQPPGWVFGVVWPILYLLLGWNWMKTKDNNLLNGLQIALTVVLNLWVYSAGCKNDYKMGALVFIPIVAVSFAVWILSSLQSIGNPQLWYLPLLLTPYLAWILFAHQLNVHIVEKQ